MSSLSLVGKPNMDQDLLNFVNNAEMMLQKEAVNPEDYMGNIFTDSIVGYNENEYVFLLRCQNVLKSLHQGQEL